MKDTLGFICIIFWITFGLYAGSSGILYHDQLERDTLVDQSIIDESKIDTSDKSLVFYEMEGALFVTEEAADAYENYLKVDSLFPWLASLPEKLVLILSSCALGALGGAIRIIRQTSFENVSLGETKFLSLPSFGGLLGIVILGLSYLLPTIILVDSENFQLRETTLMFTCLFTGIFSKRFIEALDSYFKRMMDSKLNPN